MVCIILWWCNYWHLKILNLVLTESQLLINLVILNINYVTRFKFKTFIHMIELFL